MVSISKYIPEVGCQAQQLPKARLTLFTHVWTLNVCMVIGGLKRFTYITYP